MSLSLIAPSVSQFQTVTIRAKNTKVLKGVIEPITINVIKLQWYPTIF